MPWCPICRNEYKEGYTECAECKVALVDELPDISEEDEIKISAEGMLFDHSKEIEALENLKAMKQLKDMGLLPEDPSAENLSDENADDDNSIRDDELPTGAAPYVKASVRAENYKSSASALLSVGIIGLLFLVLCKTSIIKLPISAAMSSIGFVVMLLMFLIFIGIGIWSVSAAKKLSADAGNEDELTDNILAMASELSAEYIDGMAITEDENNLSEELKFFKRIEMIRKLITERFGSMNESFLSEQAENLYGIIYEGEE